MSLVKTPICEGLFRFRSPRSFGGPMLGRAVHSWAEQISSRKLRPPRNIYTDSEVFEKKQTRKSFSTYMNWYILGYIRLLSVETLKSTFETGYQTDPRSSYCNNSNNSKIVSGNRGAAENVFLEYGVRTVTRRQLKTPSWVWQWERLGKGTDILVLRHGQVAMGWHVNVQGNLAESGMCSCCVLMVVLQCNPRHMSRFRDGKGAAGLPVSWSWDHTGIFAVEVKF